MKSLFRAAAVGALMAAFGAAHAWLDTGHMVIAALAQSGLSPTARAEADRLLKIGATGNATDFVTVASWADETKTKETGPWHYKDHHFRADGKRVTAKDEPENAVWAIERFSKVLTDRSQPDERRAEALRYLIHFVGDIHQPLHATARDSEAEPEGDKGGNTFHIGTPAELSSMERPPRNLHFLWDMGAGLFSPDPQLRTPEGLKRVRIQAATLAASLPRSGFRNVGEQNPERWALESFDDAKKYVYALKPDMTPDAAYMAKAREVSARRAALAGYRLADLINRALR
jgi:hypothetical protein